ncbi:MAG: hypothetical protein ACFE89_04385 [Candidatus Hodarchaeota archaeon]
MSIFANLNIIEQRLDKEGDTPEVRKAFWRIVGKMKRLHPSSLSENAIEKAAAIRNRLFGKPVILSVQTGLLVFLILAILAFAAFTWVLLFFESALTAFIVLPLGMSIIALNVVLGIITIFVAYGVYPWGRYLGGVIARIRFEGFYRYSPGELGLKIEYTSYLKTTQSRRKWVFGFPIPWVFSFIFVLIPIARLLNSAGIWAPLIISILFALFYLVIYKAKTGELYRFIRELKIAREVKQNQ